MNKLQNIMRVTFYQISQLLHNPRLYIIVFCNFVFLNSLLLTFRHFVQEYELKATPFLFCFLFTHASVIFCFLSGIVILFSNAPFFNRTQMFLMIRTGRKVWAFGQILYLLAGSILYFFMLYIMSVVFLIPNLAFSNAWGSVWNTLGRSDIGLEYGVNLTVSRDILSMYSPLQATGWIFLIGVLNALLLGLLLFFCNIIFRREVGIALAMLLILTPYRLGFMPTIVHYIATPAWLNPLQLIKTPSFQGPDAIEQLLILTGIIVVLILGCIWGIQRKDLPEVEE